MACLQAVHDAKSEEIGPGIYRFKAEIGASFSAVCQILCNNPLVNCLMRIPVKREYSEPSI